MFYHVIPSSDQGVTTHFGPEDDYCTGCRTVSHFRQQSYSGLPSPGRSYSTCLRKYFFFYGYGSLDVVNSEGKEGL